MTGIGPKTLELARFSAWAQDRPGALPLLAVILAVLLLVPLPHKSVAQDAGGINAIAARLGGDANRTRFVVDLSKSVDYAAKVLADPYRVIIDLPEVNFAFPPGLGRMGPGFRTECAK